MFKTNFYSLFFLFVPFCISGVNILCSSLSQPDSDQNLPSLSLPFSVHNAYPRTNNINLDSLPSDLLLINSSNMQQGATHSEAMKSLIYEELEFTNALAKLVRTWEYNAAVHDLVMSTLPSIPYNGEAIFTNMSSVNSPIAHQRNANSAMAASSDARHHNNIPPNALNPSNPSRTFINADRNTISPPTSRKLNPLDLQNIPLFQHTQQVSHTYQDKDHALAEKKKKKKHTKTYTCPTCNKTLANQSSFKYHLRTHDSNRARPWQCSICHKSFAEKNVLKLHISRHNKKKSFKCEFCNKAFKTQSEKTMHHRTHTGEKPYQCTLCGKCFAVQTTLRSHEHTHTGEKPFKCEICGKGLSSKSALKDHLNKHRGKKPYSCEECQKSFRSKRRLNEHRKLHQNPKPYKCEKCTKTYTTKEGLKYHLKTHNKLKAYICHYCGEAFAHKNEHTVHMRYEEETDDDRKCHHCKKVYSSKYHLRKHNKRAHPRK